MGVAPTCVWPTQSITRQAPPTTVLVLHTFVSTMTTRLVQVEIYRFWILSRILLYVLLTYSLLKNHMHVFAKHLCNYYIETVPFLTWFSILCWRKMHTSLFFLAPKTFLLFSQKNTISRLVINNDDFDPDTPEVVLPIPQLKNIKALSYDPIQHFLYWVEGKNMVIKKAADNGTMVCRFFIGEEMIILIVLIFCVCLYLDKSELIMIIWDSVTHNDKELLAPFELRAYENLSLLFYHLIVHLSPCYLCTFWLL